MRYSPRHLSVFRDGVPKERRARRAALEQHLHSIAALDLERKPHVLIALENLRVERRHVHLSRCITSVTSFMMPDRSEAITSTSAG